tara:strand:- start:1184 stop:1978 length:795 start_codon:yes stop_codon:yes gene_type:complete
MDEPTTFFIVPYRDREQHLQIYLNHMKCVLEGINCKILIIHQCDKRLFNRGAMKNIGFRYIKDKFPDTYKDKTLVFNDVDNVPWKKGILDFNTTKGIIKHHYGFPVKQAASLGGIFTIIASDFEKTNGFPNLWTWGMEDNALYWRSLKEKLTIDYSNYFKVGSPNIILFWHGPSRLVNEAKSWDEFINIKDNNAGFGLNNITNLGYDSKIYQERENVVLVNINSFDVPEKIPTGIVKKIPNSSFKHSSDTEKHSKKYSIFKTLF